MAPARSRPSAGILLYRLGGTNTRPARVEVLLGHMGGPFWSRKDAGAWTIPKGEYGPDEDPLDAARREFGEEIGRPVPSTSFEPLGSVRQAGGKTVSVWAAEGDLDASTTVSASFEIEWPPRSGVMRSYPELDRTAWLPPDRARLLLVRAQTAFVDRLLATIRD
ncbi:MAG: NUDIX domain-containing protein [Actinomycetota bacterium]|nr:NUDIX domain-containing protein [Actinomycetota bacterium]